MLKFKSVGSVMNIKFTEVHLHCGWEETSDLGWRGKNRGFKMFKSHSFCYRFFTSFLALRCELNEHLIRLTLNTSIVSVLVNAFFSLSHSMESTMDV